MSMFVSRSLDYAIRSLIVLAQRPAAGSTVSLSELADSAAAPRSYLAKLMRHLVRGELVRSGTGSRGGYRLARDPGDISLRTIYEAVEGTFQTVDCHSDAADCDWLNDCTQLPIWNQVEREILDVLQKRTLSDFVPREGTSAPASFVPLEQVQVTENRR